MHEPDWKRPLGEAFDQALASGRPDFPFCLAWANESWSRRWDGSESDILDVAEVICVFRLATIPEIYAVVCKQVRLGGCVSIHHVIVCRCEGGEKRCNNRKKCQNGYDDTADDRALVFAEALERPRQPSWGAPVSDAAAEYNDPGSLTRRII